MQSDVIVLARREAERFLEKVADYETRYKNDLNFRKYCHITGFKETGALRRASLDLSRALSKMRA